MQNVFQYWPVHPLLPGHSSPGEPRLTHLGEINMSFLQAHPHLVRGHHVLHNTNYCFPSSYTVGTYFLTTGHHIQSTYTCYVSLHTLASVI